MGKSDTIIILDQVCYHANTGLQSLSEDQDTLKMSWLILLVAQFFQYQRFGWLTK